MLQASDAVAGIITFEDGRLMMQLMDVEVEG